MNHIVVQARRQFRYRGPDRWADLSARQFRQYLNWQLNLGGAPAGAYALITLWYRIPYLVFRSLTDEQRLRLGGLLNFTHPLPDVWLLPRIRRGWRLYLGPGDRLKDLPFGAFAFAEASLLAYTLKPDRQHLVELATYLYAPKALFWQKVADGGRVVFNRLALPSYERAMNSLDDATLEGIRLCYIGAKQDYRRQFPDLYEPSTSSSNGQATWLDIGISVARQTGALGTFDELSGQPTFLVLTTLNAMIAEGKKLKEAAAR